ncbi:MAG: hypothetical protein RLZZ507_3132 [Cyanobacteriota bacterium]
MQVKKMVVTGDKFMIDRNKFLFQKMNSFDNSLDYIWTEEIINSKFLKKIAKSILIKFPFLPIKNASSILKKHQTFISRSQKIEQKIRNLSYTPDLVFHIYGMFTPFWDKFDIPYVIYLDYTMALARDNWTPWAPFTTDEDFQKWKECECRSYDNASHIFTTNKKVKSSLMADYGINPDKITVVYPSGNFLEPFPGDKQFGSKQILFNGSDFERKGGDLLLAAFKQVKQVIPEAKLVIVGQNLSINEDGIDNRGYISSSTEMQDLFLKTDIVVSPARCEPLPLFLIESMNYGVPCIVSEQDGMPEIIEHEINGLVIPQPTVDQLASQMIYLLSHQDVLEKMSIHAMEKVKNQLNWQVVAQKMIETINKI